MSGVIPPSLVNIHSRSRSMSKMHYQAIFLKDKSLSEKNSYDNDKLNAKERVVFFSKFYTRLEESEKKEWIKKAESAMILEMKERGLAEKEEAGVKEEDGDKEELKKQVAAVMEGEHNDIVERMKQVGIEDPEDFICHIYKNPLKKK